MDSYRCFFCFGRATRICFVALFLSFLGYQTAAHSPYLTYQEGLSIRGDEFTLALLNGDGIFFADPVRAVVLDDDGRAHAISELSATLSVLCKGLDGERNCFVYNELARVAFELDPQSFSAGMQILVNEEVQRYPESLDTEWGFVRRNVNLAEAVQLELRLMAVNLVLTMVASVWWCVGFFPLARLLRRLRSNGWRPWPVRFGPVVGTAFAMTYFGVFLFLNAYLWLLEPYSSIFGLTVGLAGFVLASILAGIFGRGRMTASI